MVVDLDNNQYTKLYHDIPNTTINKIVVNRPFLKLRTPKLYHIIPNTTKMNKIVVNWPFLKPGAPNFAW